MIQQVTGSLWTGEGDDGEPEETVSGLLAGNAWSDDGVGSDNGEQAAPTRAEKEAYKKCFPRQAPEFSTWWPCPPAPATPAESAVSVR